MKKKIGAIIAIICVVAFVLCACGGGTSGGGTAPAGSGSTTGGGESGGGAAASAETYDVGDFTVAVPTGWKAVAVSDMFSDDDAVETNTVIIAKGDPADEWAARSSANVNVYVYPKDSYMALDPEDLYENVTAIDGVKVKGITCKATSYDSMGYVYQEIVCEEGDNTIVYMILTSIDGKDTGITWEDPDVTTIMESVTVK